MLRIQITRGFTHDFTYYVANNHPFFVLLFGDRLHPFSRTNRGIELFGAIVTTFAGAGLMKYASFYFFTAAWWERIILSLICVTLPTTVFRKLLYYLYATPCTLHDVSSSSLSDSRFYRRLQGCFKGIGHCVSCAWILIFLVGGAFLWAWTNSDLQELVNWSWGVVQFYLLWFVIILVTTFNPSQTFSRCMFWLNVLLEKCSCGLVANYFGRWHFERTKIHKVIRKKVRERGIRRFFLPTEQASTAAGMPRQPKPYLDTGMASQVSKEKPPILSSQRSPQRYV